MDIWLQWASGPLFRAAFVFMVLGLVRHAVMTLWEVVRAIHRAGDKKIPARRIVAATAGWLVPVGRMADRPVFSLTSVAFHGAAILTPVFLAGHIALWERALGIGWPALPNRVATSLTVVAVVAAVGLVIQRLASRQSRALSRPGDYALPLLVAVPFVSGFLVMHPGWNPFAYEPTLLVHVLSADVLFVLVPVTKLSHIILVPATQLVSELAWRFPPDGGSKVAVALGKESEPV